MNHKWPSLTTHEFIAWPFWPFHIGRIKKPSFLKNHFVDNVQIVEEGAVKLRYIQIRAQCQSFEDRALMHLTYTTLLVSVELFVKLY